MSGTVTFEDDDGLAEALKATPSSVQPGLSADGDAVELITRPEHKRHILGLALGTIGFLVGLVVLHRVLRRLERKLRQAMLWWHYG